MQRAAVCLLGLFVLFASAELVVDITLSSNVYAFGDDIYVNWELKNVGSDVESFLIWGTPLENDWNANMFLIRQETGESAEYQGKLMKRVPPSEEHYIYLAPQESRRGVMLLSAGYKFFHAGTYYVTMGVVHHSIEGGRGRPLFSNKVELLVNTPEVKVKHVPKVNGKNAVTFTACTSSETTITNTAISNAISASQNAENYFGCSNRDMYVKWFGTYTSTNYNKIQSDFTKINNFLSGRNFGIDCSCNQPGTYAFVYPSDPTSTIHLCPVFWQATADPYDWNSQPGTLTHEGSHFNAVCGTDDIQYGVTGCLALAQSDPNSAVKNADSHEYFQENKPSC